MGMTTTELRARVCTVARGWLGLSEPSSYWPIIEAYNAYARGHGLYVMTASDPWCAAFVSAVFIKAGLAAIIPVEVSCDRMIAQYKALGRFIENDAYVPKPADVIFYDWQDSGAGDNQGSSDHVGLVVAVVGNTITVIEGNCSDAVKTIYRTVNQRYIRGYGCPDYAKIADSAPAEEAVTGEAGVWNYLMKSIGNAYGAAAMMGNLYAESALNPKNLQNSYEKSLGYTDEKYTEAVDNGSYGNFVHDSAGYGLAQWTWWSRKEALLNYAKTSRKSIGDLKMQLDFLMNEMAESYSTVLTVLKNASDIRTASDAVMVRYEAPADQSEAAKAARASFGQKYYDRYAEAVTTSPEDPIGIPTDPEWITQNVPLPVLRKGCFGNPVGNAQALLIGHGFYCGGKVVRGHEEPDGKFAAKTEEAVRAFQALFGLEIDGEIGCQTWAALVTK